MGPIKEFSIIWIKKKNSFGLAYSNSDVTLFLAAVKLSLSVLSQDLPDFLSN